MNNHLTYHKESSLRKVLVLAAAFLVVLASCSVKSSIKNLTGLPVKAGQGMATNNHRMANIVDFCSATFVGEVEITPTQSVDLQKLVPALIFAVSFLFLFGITPLNPTSHPHYRSKKVADSLPLYLQYQHLRFYS